MEHRYSLRFESGERRGETIPIPPTGVTVGRKPGNTLQILDNSVSGSHAELVVESGGVLVRDTGSTNGTRVGTQRVIEQQLAHGDTVLFGNVRLSFRDAQAAGAGDEIEIEEFEEPTPSATPVAPTAPTLMATAAPAPDGLVRISAETLAKSKKRSFAGGAVLVALAVVGAGLWFWLNRSSRAEGQTTRAVEPVAGNLIAEGYSFEDDEGAWSSADQTPAAFLRTGTARRSGAFGIEADLEAGQWAMHRSRPVRATGGHRFAARAFVRTKGDAEARVGIEFSTAAAEGTTAPASVVAWTAPVSHAAQFEPAQLDVAVPAGWTDARVVILARLPQKEAAAGEIDADDASLVDAGSDGTPAAGVGGAALFTLGTPPASAQLVRAERVLVSGIAFTSVDDTLGLDARELSASAAAPRLLVEPRGEGATSVVLRAEEPLARTRVATIGADGYRTHALDFERADVSTLLLGNGADLVRIQLKVPAMVRGKGEGPATRLSVTPAQSLEIQLDFAAERKEAGNVAHAARGAEQRGDLGGAIEQWSALLDGFPYEDALVNEAEAARTRLVQKGLEDLRVVLAEVERARFFRLADLYKKCRENALAVAARYQKSEVEAQAKKLADSVSGEIATLEVDLFRVERARMHGILAALEAQKATALAGEVRAYLTNQLGENK